MAAGPMDAMLSVTGGKKISRTVPRTHSPPTKVKPAAPQPRLHFDHTPPLIDPNPSCWKAMPTEAGPLYVCRVIHNAGGQEKLPQKPPITQGPRGA